jgi:glycosyltransferase involved in cell wall biosynthesis
MKILLAITKSNFGGAQRYIHDLAIGFHGNGDDVLVVCGGEGELVRRLNETGIRTISIPSLGRDISLANDIKALEDLAKIIRQEKPDVLHINSAKIGGIGTLLGRLFFVPAVIFTAHGWAFNESRPWWQRTVIRIASLVTVLLSHKTILVSKETGKQLGYKFLTKRKTVVIHNGRAASNFLTRDIARAELKNIAPGLDPSTIWTLSIGELHSIKGHDLMIDAVEQLSRSHPEVQHVIIGEGEIRKKLEEKIESKSLANKVFLLGQLNDAAKYLMAADIFVLPSRSEALPYVLIEAVQAGLPIIASDVGGTPEVIENNKSGILIHAGRSEEIAHAIAHLLETPDEIRQITLGVKEVAKHFTFERMLKETNTLYRSLIKK